MQVAIVGAGIGGLTAAIALTRRNVRVRVLERAPELSAAGASLALDPNASRLFEEFGLFARLRGVAVEPEAAEYVRWHDGRVLLRTPLGATAQEQFGAPALDFLRSDLQRVLVEALPEGALTLGAQVTSVRQDATGVDVLLADGGRLRADAVIAADGIHSQIRQQLIPDSAPVFSGTVVYRGLVMRDEARGIQPEAVHRYWVGPHRHSVVYWISAGNLMAVNTAVWDPDAARDSGTDRAGPAEVIAHHEGWESGLLERFRRCRTIHRGPVFVTPPLAQWAFGRVALLGDAAHAMQPFEAQGAAQAIEDAYVLAEGLGSVRGDKVTAALRRYEDLRIERATEVQQASSRAAEVFYLPDGVAQRERDADYLTVQQRQPGGRRRWIWEYDVRKVAAGHLGPVAREG